MLHGINLTPGSPGLSCSPDLLHLFYFAIETKCVKSPPPLQFSIGLRPVDCTGCTIANQYNLELYLQPSCCFFIGVFRALVLMKCPFQGYFLIIEISCIKQHDLLTYF